MSEKTLKRIEKAISFAGYSLCTICAVIMACICVAAIVLSILEQDPVCMLGAVAAAIAVWVLYSVKEEL